LVSAYPAKSLAIAQFIDGYKLDTGPVQNAQTGLSYTFALTDTTKTVTANNAAASVYTVPPQSSVVWENYTTLRIVNLGAGVVTLTAGAGVTLTGTLAMPVYASATLIRTALNTWTVVGIASLPSSATAAVATSQGTTSTSYTDLATAGPAATLTTGTKALLVITTFMEASIGGYNTFASFAVSGATTIAASDTRSVRAKAGVQVSAVYLLTTLTAGSNTFTMKYKAEAGSTATFSNREIAVIDLGS
jgi:hypothetical protein